MRADGPNEPNGDFELIQFTRLLWLGVGVALVLFPALPIPAWVGAEDRGPVWAPNVAAWAIGLLVVVTGGLLAGRIATRLELRKGGRLRIPPLAVVGALALTLTAAALYVMLVVFAGNPHLVDEIAQLFDARAFAAGRLAAPVPEPAEAFLLINTLVAGDGWMSQYPPGFLSRIGNERDQQAVLSQDALDAIMVYDWPGNVRELENALEHAAILARDRDIGPDVLPSRITDPKTQPWSKSDPSPTPPSMSSSGLTSCGFCKRRVETRHALPRCWPSIRRRCIASSLGMTQIQSSVPIPRDAVGAATLERMSGAPAFNRWMFDRLSRWIGSRVLEIGSGIGNMSQFFIDRERVVLTDTESAYRSALKNTFGNRENVEVLDFRLPQIPDALSDQQFDTIVCLNVLEHIEDDTASLTAMHSLLEPSRVLKKGSIGRSRGERAPDALDAGALGPGPAIRKPCWYGGLCPGRAPRRPSVLSPLPSATAPVCLFSAPC